MKHNFTSTKKFFLLSFVICIVSNVYSQNEKIYVNLTNGHAQSYEFSAVHKLTFSKNGLNLFLNNGSTNFNLFSDLLHITFVPYHSGGNPETSIESTSKRTLNIYPNPVKNELRIMNYELKSGEKVSIFDVSGRQVILANSTTIDVSTLTKGIYFVKTGDNAAITKIIKE